MTTYKIKMQNIGLDHSLSQLLVAVTMAVFVPRFVHYLLARVNNIYIINSCY